MKKLLTKKLYDTDTATNVGKYMYSTIVNEARNRMEKNLSAQVYIDLFGMPEE